MSAAGDVHAGVGTDAGGGAGSSSSHGGGGPHTAAEKLHAESYPLPDATYYAIEHPGYAATAEKLILTLGGMQRVQQAFAQERGYIDLNFCPSDPFMHSIAGDILPTANLLLRVVRRTNKRTGETTIEHRVAGVVSKTCRFRALADFQFETDPTDPIVQLRHQMQDLDVEAFRKPIFDTKTQGISDQLNQLPPPSFSRSEWPQEYKYTENPAVKLKLEGTDPAGRPIFRHVNESRVKRTQAPIFDPTAPSVPMHAPSWVSKKSALEPTLRELFEQRPVWTRIALINNIEIADYSTDMLKDALPMVAYFCATGAWRSTWVRYGFDPRADRSSRVFQTLDLRAVKQAQYTRAKRVLTKKDAAAATAIASTREPDPSERSRTSHIFDGQTYNALALFQMCDVTDPDMRNLIHSARYCRAEPDVSAARLDGCTIC
nr:tau 95 subunit of transcription factor TFIIIC [Polyrhizophydium stewartii]